MKRHSGIASWILRTAISRPAQAQRRKRARPGLEQLEQREVLSAFTWAGTAGDGNWDTGTNWVGGIAPKSGPVDITFSTTATDQTITLQSDDTGLQFSSLTVAGGTYTLQGPTTNGNQQLTLAAGATVSLDMTKGASLTICPPSPGSLGANSLALNFLGATTLSGGGVLTFNNGAVSYSGNPVSLLPLTVDGSILTLGSSASFAKSLLQLANRGDLVVNDGVSPSVGSLTGTGTIQLSVAGGKTGTTGLIVNTPSGESDQLLGNVQGPGGTITMAGAGSLVIARINPVTSALIRSCSMSSRAISACRASRILLRPR